MDTVSFISATTTKKRDLILSFAIHDPQWPKNIRSLILLRSPAQEWVFKDHERGIAVSMEGEKDDTSDLEGQLLTEFTFDAQAKTATVKTRHHSYDLDLQRVKPEQITQMQTHLTRMNFDSRTRYEGL